LTNFLPHQCLLDVALVGGGVLTTHFFGKSILFLSKTWRKPGMKQKTACEFYVKY